MAHTASNGPAAAAEPEIGAEIIWTAPTGTDASIGMPDQVQRELLQLGLRHEKIGLTRVESSGTTTTSILDLTPHVGDRPDAPVLKVQARAEAAVQRTLTRLTSTLNVPAAGPHRSLYVGLLKADFAPGAPVYIFSSGLDDVDPVSFTALGWDVPPATLVDGLRAAGELPALHHSPVTFILTPTAGAQEQLRTAQKDYRADVWRQLLRAGGASSVTFVDASGGPSPASAPGPTIPLPKLPGTPIAPTTDPVQPHVSHCTLSTQTYFVADTATFMDRAATEKDLRPCVAGILDDSDTVVELDGWVAYWGKLGPDGRPATNPPQDIELSQQRVRAVADLLIALGVPSSRITRMTGHGAADQPEPQSPRSPANRAVRITVTSRS